MTEGKTDSRYIKAALRRYYLEYPNLISKEKDGFKYNITFLPHSNRLRYFFGILEGGGGEQIQLLSYFMNKDNHAKRNYLKYFEEISTELSQKPTIFLVDNEWKENKPLDNIVKFLSKSQKLNKKSIQIFYTISILIPS